MIPITSGLGLSLVWLGSMVVSVVIYGTVEPCGRAVCSVFSVCPGFIDQWCDGEPQSGFFDKAGCHCWDASVVMKMA